MSDHDFDFVDASPTSPKAQNNLTAQGDPIFNGVDGLKCPEFIQAIRRCAFTEGKSRDDAWLADKVAICVSGPALIWFEALDDSVQRDWKLLRHALLQRYSEPASQQTTELVPRGNPKAGEVYVDNPDEGWDAETEGDALVIDYDTKQEMKKTIAQTAAMLNPKHPLNGSYAFQKVFMDGEFVAGGVLEIPVGGKKPSKPARDNTYLFYCIEGAIRVVVHQNTFVIARNGMFMVPRGNQYHLENISNHRCKLFFAQARKVTEKIILHRPKRTSMAPSAREASASQTPEPAASVVMNSTVSSDPGKGPNCS